MAQPWVYAYECVSKDVGARHAAPTISRHPRKQPSSHGSVDLGGVSRYVSRHTLPPNYGEFAIIEVACPSIMDIPPHREPLDP